MQYTKRFIRARFNQFCEALGLVQAPMVGNKFVVGSVSLGYNSGWDIEQIANEGGAIRQINGWCNRLNGRELVAFMDGAVFAVERARLSAPIVATSPRQEAFNSASKPIAFRDLGIGDTFDFVAGNGCTSFRERCRKVSARAYQCTDAGAHTRYGKMRVGTVAVTVHNVKAV